MGGEVMAVIFLFSSYAHGSKETGFLLGPHPEKRKKHWATWSSPPNIFFYLAFDVGPKLGASFYGEEEGGSISVRLDPGIVSSLIILQHKNLNFYLKFFF